MADIEQITSEERVRWVLTIPRSERPERGPLPKLGFWKEVTMSMRFPDHLRDEVRDGFLTVEEALSAETARIGWMSSDERVEYVLSVPSETRPKKGPLEEQNVIGFFMPEDLVREVNNGYLTLDEAKSVAESRKEEKRAAAREESERLAGPEPILHVIDGISELKVYPGYLEWGSRWLKMGKFNTLPFSRIQKIERRRAEYTLMFRRSLYIETTDGTSIELLSFNREDAEFVTRTIYRVMGGDHTKVGKINLT